MGKLKKEFYLRNDVTAVARDLLGKALITNVNGKLTSGIIVETEAYSWREKACHAYQQRRTARTEVMFGAGGHAYVYLCYGIHHLFNIVTNERNVAEAVLVRAVEPDRGAAHILQRTGVQALTRVTSGPGKLTRALGIDAACNGQSLLGKKIWLEDVGYAVPQQSIKADVRIGVDYAGADALLPWRFLIANHAWVSKK
jgi:DNA-3-methyladenine glycosylase